MRALRAMGAYAMILLDGKLAWVFSSHKKEMLQAYINGDSSAVHSWEDKRKEKTVAYYREDESKEKSQRKRSSRFVIRVEYPNGKVFCSKDVGVTLVDVILYAGPEKVRQLNITCLGDNLVSHRLGKNSIYRAAQKKIDDGLYVCICASEEMIYRQILMIDYGCRLGLKVEKEYLGGYVPVKKKKSNPKRNATKKSIDPEDEIFEEVDDSKDEIYREGKIGDKIRLFPSHRKGEIIGTRIDHEGYERLVIRTEDYHLIEIDNNPYLYVVLKQK